MSRTDRYDLIYNAMFEPEAKSKLARADQELVNRVETTYSIWLEHPTYTELQIRDFLMTNFGVTKATACSDIGIIRMVLGSVQNASKEFYRYKANHILDLATIAAQAGDHQKAKSLTKIAEAYAKTNRLNIDEGEKIPWDKIIPQNFSFSVDPTHAGITVKPGSVERAKKLRRKLLEEDIIDVEYENSEPLS